MERGGGGRDVKEKRHSSANNAAKDTVVVSSPAVDEHVVAVGSTKDVNVGKSVNFRTLTTPARNETDVAVPLESIRDISERQKNNVNTSGNKKKDAESRKEVSNLNSFDVLNSVENDVDLGTNGGTSNLASK
nr:hypothetical protein [Tanacetum cinerariifolium]